MTTAHRPTWKAAVAQPEGGWSAGGASSAQSSARDLLSHKKLKVRSGAQLVGSFPRRRTKGVVTGVAGPDGRRAELLEESVRKMEELERKSGSAERRAVRVGRERALLEYGGAEVVEKEGRIKLLKQTADVDEEKIRSKYDDDDDGGEGGSKNGDGGGGWSDLDNNGGEGRQSDDSDLDASSSDDNDSDDEDEMVALQAELAKIRAERADAKAKEDEIAATEEQARNEEAALTGNPLLKSAGGVAKPALSSGRLKRRWNDDVVFRNQARNEPDQQKKRFINDTVRNDFHKRFLNKFIW